MPGFWCQPGDLLFYFHPTGLGPRLIEIGEHLEDGPGTDPYHVAIAVGRYDKIEAAGWRTVRASIDYGAGVVCRPPYDTAKLPLAIAWLQRQLGRFYGWLGVVDQGLRDLSRGYVHLPRWLIAWADTRWPFCSTLAADFANRARWAVPQWPPPSPEDLWRLAKPYQVWPEK